MCAIRQESSGSVHQSSTGFMGCKFTGGKKKISFQSEFWKTARLVLDFLALGGVSSGCGCCIISEKGFPTSRFWANWLLPLSALNTDGYILPATRCCVFSVLVRLTNQEKKKSLGFTGRCAVTPLPSFSRPQSLPVLAAAVAMPELGFFFVFFYPLVPSLEGNRGRLVMARHLCNLFPRWCQEVTVEAEGRGSAVRDGPFVVAFVAGVLPFSVKA